MSEPITSQATRLKISNSAQPVDAQEVSGQGVARTTPDDSRKVPVQVQPAEPSLWGEIMKVWEWLVFIWRMLPRIGGLGALVRTLFLIISLLTTRLLVQWGILKNEKEGVAPDACLEVPSRQHCTGGGE